MTNGIAFQLYANPFCLWLVSLPGITDLATGYDQSTPGRTIDAFVEDDLEMNRDGWSVERVVL